MCGLVAKIYSDSTKLVPEEDNISVGNALSKLKHRGPDGEGMLVVKGAILSHVRLSILDLSDTGAQPMSSECSRYHLVYNGEIFNYQELQDELRVEGIVCSSGCDTEVLLKAYIKWGPECLSKLNGMFAFVVYDSVLGTYFAARDHFGIKPLYYLHHKDCIFFASEMKALIEFLPERVINQEYLGSYLYDSALDYGANCLLEGIKQVQSGFYLTSSSSSQVRWYDLETSVNDRMASGLETEEYRNELERAVKIRLRSDVPVTYTLSGGMDSSSIYAMGSKTSDLGLLKAYTLLDSKLDSPIHLDMLGAKAVVEKIGGELRHVKLDDETSVDSLKESIYFQDFPSWSLSHVTYDNVYQKIRDDGFKVLIEGHGNDEILGGYPNHILDCAQSLLQDRHFTESWRACKAYVNAGNTAYSKTRLRAWMVLIVILIPGLRSLIQHIKLFNSPFKRLFPKSKYKRKLPSKTSSLTFMQRTLMDLVVRTIVPSVLRTFDRSTMRASIEMRPPFMDPNIVEISLALKDSSRVSNESQKGILRSAMALDLPKSITNNSVKSGFTNDIRVMADLFSPDVIIKSFPREIAIIGLDYESYSLLFKEYCKQRDWERGVVINKVGSLLCWAQVFEIQR
jgi:asparagine synthase (glutamine-hydrolysing)